MKTNEFPMMMEVPDDARIEDVLRGLANDGLDDFLDLLTMLRDQNKRHGCERLETELTENDQHYFHQHGGVLLAFGDPETVFQAHDDLRKAGNHRPASVTYDQDGQFYLFQFPTQE